MTATRIDPGSGIVVFDRIKDDTDLAVNTAATLTSDYSEEGSIPGIKTVVAGRSLIPVVKNAQSSSTLTLTVGSSGFANKAGLTLSTDGGTSQLGWNAPFTVRSWEPIDFTDSHTYKVYSAVVVPSTQALYVVYSEYGTGDIYMAVRSNTTGLYTKTTIVTTVAATVARALCLLVTPDESKLILIQANASNRIRSLYSLDNGTTWKTLKDYVGMGVTLPSACERMSGCFVGNDICLIAYTKGDDAHHYASSDFGASFDFIESFDYSANEISSVKVCPRLGGNGAIVSYIGYNTGDALHTDVKISLISNAYDLIVNSPEQLVYTDGTEMRDVGCCSDYDGIIYVFATYGPTGGWIWTSIDGGATWDAGTNFYQTDDASDYFTYGQIIARGGEIRLLHNHNANPGNEGGSLSCFRLNGWSSIETFESPDHVWTPFDIPDAMGWTHTGATNGTIVNPSGYLNITTAASQGYYNWNPAATTSLTPGFDFGCRINSGGALTSNDAVVALLSCSGAQTYNIRIRFTTTGFRVRDEIAGTTVVDVTWDMTLETHFKLAFTSAGKAILAYKRPVDTTWTYNSTVAAATFTGSGAGSANWAGTFGNVTAAGTADTDWRFAVMYDDYGSVTANSNLIGKTLNSYAYPTTYYNSANEIEFVSVVGGLGLNTETYSIAPAHTYALSNIFPANSPSTSVKWRSTTRLADQKITLNLNSRTYLGNALAVYFGGINFKTSYLEYYDGSVWQTAATLNASQGFSGLDYTTVGDMVSVNTGSDPGIRYIGKDELVDSWLLQSTGSAVRIAGNSGGLFSDVGTVALQMRVTDDSILDPTDVLDICYKDALMVYYPASAIIRQYWRIRIPAQDGPEDYFEAGIIAIGNLIPFGQDISWGHQEEIIPNNESFTDKSGVEVRNALGNELRTWNVDFSDGINLHNVLQEGDASTATPDYVGISGGVKLQVAYSNEWQLKGIMKATDQYSVPVVVVKNLPQSSTTINNPRSYLYSYIDGSIAITMVSGTENEHEMQRIERVTFKGIR